MIGSLAVFSASTGNAHRGLLFLEKARNALPNSSRHAVVDAWMSSTAAITHAAAGDEKAAWGHIDDAEEAVTSISSDEQPPWPWVMRFDAAKLAGYRLTTAVNLGYPDLALECVPAATTAQARNHTAQYALTLLDQATAHSMKAEYEQSASVALIALNVAAVKNSHRVVRAAWRTRQAIPAAVTCDAINQLDARLHELDPIDI